MKNTKEIIIGIFAVIGVLALVTGFANNTENVVQTTTPESHVQAASEITTADANDTAKLFLYNKVTGEVRKYNGRIPILRGNVNLDEAKGYIVTKNIDEIE